ncbi:MAG: Fic family protein [Bacteroidetes bacterium]|nr:Fic family protein [Bacteroidota bacterium]
MAKGTHFSQHAPVFNGLKTPEEGFIVGYAAIIQSLDLQMPIPKPISLVCKYNKKYQNNDWQVLPNTYLPEDNIKDTEIVALYKHLTFALKYEGVNLLFFKLLIQHYNQMELTQLVQIEPTGQYSRRIWFLIEWLTKSPLPGKEDLSKKSYVPLLDDKVQFGVAGVKSPRHLIINNLPGTPDFCPLIRKTPKLDQYIAENLAKQQSNILKDIHKDILQRASAFLLLKDSKASFHIEGETPKSQRAARWGKAIGQAGAHDLSKQELLRLQQIVIADSRFVDMGFREKGGFVGEHDRTTGEPIPDHISARWKDLDQLMDGFIATSKLLQESDMDAVIAAAMVAFGFVFIHPFEDGNGRIHRYLIHHVLAQKEFSKQGIIFPVSASILDHINDYRKALESYSHPLLDFIEWKETKDHNVEVLNETIDYYRYFDATKLAEFLYDCVKDTIERIIPEEIDYLTKYDQFKRYLENEFDLPDKAVDLIVRFLNQNKGKFSKRALEKEFSRLTEKEVKEIENNFKGIFNISD